MSRVTSTTYPIGSPTRQCAATGRELATGEPFVAALVQGGEGVGPEDFRRLDFGAESWAKGARPGGGALLLGYWKGILPEPGAKRRLLVDDASLLELFEQSEGELDPAIAGGGAEKSGGGGQSAESSEPDRLAFRFMLALILLRKKLLISEKTGGLDGKSMFVRARGSPKPSEGGELMEVVDPGMDAAAVERVTGRLAAVLCG